ncbi:hypothetical protein Ami103574_02390 [Aminipila butyrica]|uniref:Uncharacterized protein n=1 Tax=Aminipila butyrica TaxID=433296 RepID=A0A858BT18_9FIRM|nr:hypothetical protein [Aminipila butyrica]QIB68228.1 hypothetical protein Ami103574_02390 [Aminipila butyrica]
MTKFEVLKSITDVKEFSSVVFELSKDKQTPQEIENLLTEEITEKELQMLKSIAQTDYPLSLDGKQ